MLQGTAGYRQISSTIREELAAAERLQASLETERPLPGAKGSPILLPASERVMLWRPLVERLEATDAAPSDEEVAALYQEYEWAKAIQVRLSRRVAWYQLAFMMAIGFFAVAPLEIEEGRGDLQHLAEILPYLLASFWGAVGGSAASLWELLKQVEGRTLSASGATSHFLRPYLGAVLGLLVSLILPTNLLDITGTDLNLTGYALAALAGLSERTFITKLQQLLEVILGQGIQSRLSAASARPAGTPALPVSEPRTGTSSQTTTPAAQQVAAAFAGALPSHETNGLQPTTTAEPVALPAEVPTTTDSVPVVGTK